MDLEKMKERIRLSDDPHFPYTRLICVENTHNYCGGKVIPVPYMKKVLAQVFFISTSVLICLNMLINAPLPFPILLGVGNGYKCYIIKTEQNNKSYISQIRSNGVKKLLIFNHFYFGLYSVSRCMI